MSTPKETAALEKLLEHGVIGALDLHFARFLATLAVVPPDAALAAALLSRSVGEGHTCLDLRETAGGELGDGILRCPPLAAWEESLRRSELVGEPGEAKPLILDGSHRLYLERYHRYERTLAQEILERVRAGNADVTGGRLREALGGLFPGASAGPEPDMQALAALTAAMKRFCVISGGPGSGKTTTVAAILKLLNAVDPHKPLRIALTAPTGKAASRLGEAMQQAGGAPLEGRTVHRLLRELASFRAADPDVVVVDEVSMADLSLMSRLMDAVPRKSRVIWLGDKDQLSSVEAGAVLGDVCGASERVGCSAEHAAAVRGITGWPALRSEAPAESAPDPSGEPPAALRDCIVLLDKSYRFSGAGGIGASAAAVRRGDAAGALRALSSSPDAAFCEYREAERFSREFGGRVNQAYARFAAARSPEEALSLLERFRVLCALRRGPYGAEALNRRIERLLAQEGRLAPYHRWYSHRPVLVVRNDYGMRLFNGDVGIVFPSNRDAARLAAFFPDGRGGLREIPPVMLPEHETVFAMTVHKSQGSEYDEVLFLLPPQPSEVLSRELVYTALTRARARVEVWGKKDVFTWAVDRPILRNSGLREALWGPGLRVPAGLPT